MKLGSHCDIRLAGRPSGVVEVLPEPDVLYLPLRSRRFRFSEICVKEGQEVQPGQILAKDPENYSVPLPAPRAGTVRLDLVADHLVLEGVTPQPEEPYDPREDDPHLPRELGSGGMKRYKLLTLGAWQFLSDAHTESLPDPFGTPRAIIVSTLQLEPFLARGDVQITKRLSSFTRGLEHLQSLLEYQPIYLVLPEEYESELVQKLRDAIRGYVWVKVAPVPLRYPRANFAVLARSLGMQMAPGEPVWALNTEGVLAVDRALTLSRPCTVRIVSLGGPAVKTPVHLKAIPGYPLEKILEGRTEAGPTRVLDGGALTGLAVSDEQKGLSVECTGLTVLEEQSAREVLAFTRPGGDRRSYSKCFTSSLRGAFAERLTTGLRGERRPCIACGYCEEVCPAGIMPHLIHKVLYQGELEDVQQVRVDLCVRCGLCSFVCPSKLDLRGQFVDAQEAIRKELHAEEVQA